MAHADHALVKNILDGCHAATDEQLKPIESDLAGLKARRAALEQVQSKKKADELTEEEKADAQKCSDDIKKQEEQRDNILGKYAEGNPLISQLIDLALLQNGLLRGEALSRFVNRSIELMK